MFATLYDRAFSWDPGAELDTIKSLLRLAGKRDTRSILDAGAGTGRFLVPLAKMGFECTALEPDQEMVNVLRSKSSILDGVARDRVRILQGTLEEFESTRQFDLVLLMTDTISYIWPLPKLRRALKVICKALAHQGLALIDVGLWDGYVGESRTERWVIDSAESSLAAMYSASLIKITARSAQALSRRETLCFRMRSSTEGEQIASREALLHAFTFSSLCYEFERAGLRVIFGAVPGQSEILSLKDIRPPRAMLAIKKREK